MWEITIGDLTFRRRQFVLVVAGTGLVLAIALLITGMSAGFHSESNRTLAAIGGDGWVVPAGTPGPFGSLKPLPGETVTIVAGLPGVRSADPILVVPEYVRTNRGFENTNLIGYRPGGIGTPPVVSGWLPSRPTDMVADTALRVHVGDSIRFAGHLLHVVGLTRGRTIFGGVPTIYLPLSVAQRLVGGGADLIAAVAVRGRPARLPADLAFLTRAQLHAGMLHPMAAAERSIATYRVLLWIVAVAVVAGVIYMAALERLRDFAVFKAIGASSRAVVAGLVVESVVVTVGGSVLALGIVRLLRPAIGAFPVTFTAGAQAAVPAVAVLIGLAASVAGVRRALRTDPALAFGAGV